MKHLIFACLLALIACSKDDPAPNSIVGNWTFKGVDVSGSITISEFSNELVVDNIGSFTIDGIQYTVTDKNKVFLGSTPGVLESLWLQHDDIYIGFFEVDINSSFSEMTSPNHEIYMNNTVKSGGKIVFVRK